MDEEQGGWLEARNSKPPAGTASAQAPAEARALAENTEGGTREATSSVRRAVECTVDELVGQRARCWRCEVGCAATRASHREAVPLGSVLRSVCLCVLGSVPRAVPHARSASRPTHCYPETDTHTNTEGSHAT
jgi:hypothetical protein